MSSVGEETYMYELKLAQTVGFLKNETDSNKLKPSQDIYVNTHNKSLLTKDCEDPRKWSRKYCC